jgi:hypothetical protein
MFQIKIIMNSMAVTAAVSAIITWIFMYLDSRLFDTPKTKLTYIKGMSFVAALSATIVYFMGGSGSSSGIGLQSGGVSRGNAAAGPGFGSNYGGGGPQMPGTNTSMVQGHGISEEIFSGLPPF